MKNSILKKYRLNGYLVAGIIVVYFTLLMLFIHFYKKGKA